MLFWRVLTLLIIPTILLACSSESSAPPTVNLQATIEAQVQATLEHQKKPTPLTTQARDTASMPDPTLQVQGSSKLEPVKSNDSSKRGQTITPITRVDKDQAVSLYPPDSTQSLLSGALEWPAGFGNCMQESIGNQKLESFKDNPGNIGGMDKDSAAICLLSIELDRPGSTDYIKGNSRYTAKTPSNDPNTGNSKTKPASNTKESYSSLDKDQATALYPQDVTNDILSGILEWPLGFEECIQKTISTEKLASFKDNTNAIGGMDKDATAICLLSVELNSPGSTDYIKASATADKPSSGHSGTKDKPNGSDTGSGNAIRAQAQDLFASTELYQNMVANILTGSASSPSGFDECISSAIGADALIMIRANVTAEAMDRDEAMICLFSLGYQPEELILSTIPVETLSTTYQYGNLSNKTGPFVSNQDADIVLGAIDFNTTGGPLLFNHPSGIATDGTRLLMADSYNNRVLIWNTLPESNESPDIVLGQENFYTNAPGTGRSNMNWPKSIATDGEKVVVTDTYNDRILIWNEFPNENGEAADIVLQGSDTGTKLLKNNLLWPWGVWTDGDRLAITSTQQGGVLIWNDFPTRDNESADIKLTGNGALGTPRQITSDGNSLIIGDHNASVNGQRGVGTFFWKTFPDRDEKPYDFYMSDPIDLGTGAPWMRGDFTADSKLLVLGSALYVWDSFPEDSDSSPTLTVNGGYEKWGASFLKATDHTDLAIAGDKVFLTTNYHTISVYDSIPINPEQKPDFVIGGPDIYTNTLESNNFLFNPIPATDGKSLFVVSDAGYMHVWKNIPQESGVAPDYIYSIGPDSIAFSVGDVTLFDETLILGGRDMILKWDSLPTSGEPPDILLDGQVGSVKIGNVSNESLGITGVAMDENYFYMALSTDKIHIWEGFPSPETEPIATLDNIRALNLHSDGTYLVASNGDKHTVTVYRVSDLLTNPKQNIVGGSNINGAAGVYVGNGQLFIADNGFSRIHVWNDVEDAIRGRSADALIGNQSRYDAPQIGINKLFLPKFLTYDGTYLWVGEVKFSNRLLRFSHNDE